MAGSLRSQRRRKVRQAHKKKPLAGLCLRVLEGLYTNVFPVVKLNVLENG
jgi:hypothetical protein